MIKLVRENDGKTIIGSKVRWVEWESEFFKETHTKPAVGLSCIVDPSINYTWLTTQITELLKETDELVKFKTKNSIYTLYYEN